MMAAQKIQPAGRALVLGMGVTGASCARFLAAQGRAALFADTRSMPPGLAAVRAAMPDAPLHTGELPADVPAEVSEVIVSPGVDLDLPLLQAARDKGLAIRSDIDLFIAAAAAPVLAITGSNGKSTVTALTGELLAAAGKRVAVGGNLGTPALDLLDQRNEAYVVELSSFQLERSAPVRAAAAVLLNVSPDHLDRHADMAQYGAAKARVYAGCRIAVVNRDQPALWRGLAQAQPQIGFGLGRPAAGDFGLLEGPDGEWLARGHERLLPVSGLALTGRHNHGNALAALALVAALGVSPTATLPALRRFAGLPHRMQLFSAALGLRWIDDSKATNVGAAVTALGALDGPLVLIAGGDGKNQDFRPLAAALRGRRCSAVLLGRDRERMASVLAGVCPVELVDDLPAAVRAAVRNAPPAATVLLAPACSSLDMFASYSARGLAFQSAVRELAEQGP